MILFVLVYLGGVLTIVSPCILPVLPFVFARADRPFARSGLPLLAGMTATFAAVATLAAVGGSWAIQVNQYGRLISIALLANGFDVKWVMSQVGHANSTMTMDVYAQLEQRVNRQHGTAFDDLVRRAKADTSC